MWVLTILRLLENPIYKDYVIVRKSILYPQAKIRLKITLTNDDTLGLFEYMQEINDALIPQKYSYHWQDSSGKLKKRWDNAPHHIELENFPHHIHNDDLQVEKNSVIPNILKVLDEIEKQH